MVLPSPGTASFASIPGVYFALMIHWIARGNDSAATSEIIEMQCNSDATAGNYESAYVANGVAATASGYARGGILSGSTASAGYAGTGTIWLPGYASTAFNKQLQQVSGYHATGSTYNTEHGSAWWLSTSAITQIDLLCHLGTEFTTGSEFYLYGIA